MKLTVIFRKDNKNVKKPTASKNGVSLIYPPRQLKISPMQFQRYDIEITVTLPKNLQRYFTSKFKTDETEQICGDTQRIWVAILNRSLNEEIVIKKSKPFRFFVFEK